MADEGVQTNKTSFHQEGKLSLKADDPQVGQWHEDVERAREYNHIIIFLERTWNLNRERRVQVNTIAMEHFHKSGPANKQHTYQSNNQPQRMDKHLENTRK